MGGAQKRKVRAKSSSIRKRLRGKDEPVEEPKNVSRPKDEAVGRYIRALKAETDPVSNVAAEERSSSSDEVMGNGEGDREENSSRDGSGDSGEGSSSSDEGDVKPVETSGGNSASAKEAPLTPVSPKEDLPNVHVTVVLESANLEAVKLPGSKGGHALLSSDDHGTLLRKMKRDPNDARPDITHQCLLTLMDSPLNKAGKLTVYIRTKRNALIAVHPQTRIPRTIRRFSGLMVELLQRLKVRSTNGTQPLLQVIRNPVVSHLPLGQRRIACTYNCENIVDVRDQAKDTVETELRQRKETLAQNAKKNRHEERQDDDVKEKDEPVQVLYIVGAMAHGKVDVDYADEEVCISEYPLSASTVCARITYTYECMMGIL